MQNSLMQFDDLIRERSLLTHYFYAEMWSKGKLTKGDLCIYAKEYYSLVKSVPGVVTRVRDHARDRRPDLVACIDENILEEAEHTTLWKRFAESLGVCGEEIESYEPTEQVRGAVSSLEALSESSFEEGVAAMYALELQQPAIARSKKDGLCMYYGLTSINAHAYFDEHLNEEAHFAVWRKVKIDPVLARSAIEKSLTAQHQILDGVCERCGICRCVS